MSVRPYVMMPYLASILLVATTIMMMSFTTGFGATTCRSYNSSTTRQRLNANSIHDRSHLQQLSNRNCCRKNKRRIRCSRIQTCSHTRSYFSNSSKIDSAIRKTRIGAMKNAKQPLKFTER